MRTRRNRAFTLIEILIVVVILGILAAIVVPQFTQASDDAELSSAKTQLQTVRTQMELYKFDNSGYPATLAAMETGGYLTDEPKGAIGDWTFTYTYTDADTATYTAADGDGNDLDAQ
jgi:general secretion pathway protein G